MPKEKDTTFTTDQIAHLRLIERDRIPKGNPGLREAIQQIIDRFDPQGLLIALPTPSLGKECQGQLGPPSGKRLFDTFPDMRGLRRGLGVPEPKVIHKKAASDPPRAASRTLPSGARPTKPKGK